MASAAWFLVKQMSNSAEQIIAKIKKYRKDKLIEICISAIQLHDSNPSKLIPYWSYLTLLKWTFEFSNNLSSKKIPNNQDCKLLATAIFNIMSNHDFSDLDVHGFKLFKVLAYQQFRFQRNDFEKAITKAHIVFAKNELRHKYSIDESFKKLTGLTLEEFYQSIFILKNYIETTKNYNFDDSIKGLFNYYLSKGKTNLFFNLISLNIRETNEFISQANIRIKNYNAQVFDNELFFNYPLIRFGSKKYRFLNMSILCNTAELWTYSYLKKNDQRFNQEFGSRVEKYVVECLKETNLNYITETELKNRFPGSKVVDVLIEEQVLVECKGIEIKPNVSIYPSSVKITNELKSSIIKAITQQITTISNNLSNGKELFGLVITYRDLMLGNLSEIWDDFLREELKKICEQNNLKDDLIPETNFHILSLADWEDLCSILKKGNFSLYQILKDAKRNENPTTQKFSFSQYLKKYELSDRENLIIKADCYKNLIESINPKKKGTNNL